MPASPPIDEAYSWLSQMVTAFLDLVGEVEDESAGVKMSIEELGVETPIELDVKVRDDGTIELGCAPPLYHVDVSVQPVFHVCRFTAVRDETLVGGDA